MSLVLAILASWALGKLILTTVRNLIGERSVVTVRLVPGKSGAVKWSESLDGIGFKNGPAAGLSRDFNRSVTGTVTGECVARSSSLTTSTSRRVD